MADERLSLSERLSYGFGDLGTSLAYNMASAFLLYYYTDVVRLPAAAVGTVFLIARLLDAVIDVVVGVFVDRTRSRWGRTRPWFLFNAVPYAVVTVLLFNVPAWSEGAQIAYAFVTFKALGILMSLQAIPYTALMPMMTQDRRERLKLSGMRSIGTSVSVVLGTAATMPLVGLFGGTDQQRGFAAVAILFAGIGLISTLALFRNCRERFQDPSAPRFAILPAAGQMLRNRAWLVCFGFCFIYFIRFGIMMSATTYFAIEVLHRPWMISILLPAVSGMLLLSAFVAPPILARMGIRRGSVAVLAISAMLFAVLPLAEGNSALFLSIYILACLATSITITAAFTMIAETVDYHEWKFGVRREGLLSAGVSLATKVGMAIGTAGFAYILGATGYTPGTPSETATEAIRWTYYGSAVVLLAMQTVVALFWPVDGLRNTIRADLSARTPVTA
ncbi:glycoside-pentoside-hexuronide (GPH):cation symporter [Sphingobium sp. DEHP117]|uniref:MFS transporter n=1 Tax=Sphingobium sp. DEHP117 TaxID=2993436 RepID=UPI0027D705F6|nr:glycoside-pentoside-hexuronide (GPH):cation symporter [Sphingobium sp. DEHP117]MDQ4419292.1 glycoside-pentoside-hexuronide (GPH):cation symporter [Sphingobium sp. DEHP117]